MEASRPYAHAVRNLSLDLIDVIQQLSFARDLPTVQAVVQHAARALTGADGATFVLRDSGMCYYADEDAIAPLWKGKRFPMESCISGWVMLNRQPAVVPDIAADPRIPFDAYRPTFVKSLVMVPIRIEEPIGAIGNYWATEYQATDVQIRTLQALANTTAVALENVRLCTGMEELVHERTRQLQEANRKIEQLSLTDDLTGLYNRRGFFALASRQRAQARRSGDRQFVLYVDVDGLKTVNDEFGHGAGDTLLQALACLLRKTFREDDLIARMGGDEFCVFGTMTGEGDAIVRRLEQRIARFNASGQEPRFRLSASLGIEIMPPGSDIPIEQSLRVADERMYGQKRRHRGFTRSPDE